MMRTIKNRFFFQEFDAGAALAASTGGGKILKSARVVRAFQSRIKAVIYESRL